MGRTVQFLAVVVGFLAVAFLFVGLVWTEWPQTLVGIGLAVAALFVWVAGGRRRRFAHA
jgi:hypothetical protein